MKSPVMSVCVPMPKEATVQLLSTVPSLTVLYLGTVVLPVGMEVDQGSCCLGALLRIHGATASQIFISTWSVALQRFIKVLLFKEVLDRNH